MPLRVLLVVTSAALIAGCSGNGSSPTTNPSATINPVSPSAAAATSAAAQGTSTSTASKIKEQGERLVTMQDACDPQTFNAVIGPGTCVRAGGVTFDNFIAALTKHGSIGGWHFAPPNTHVQQGTTFLAINRGGEEHTFTEVAEFGGGIVSLLNDLAHTPVIAPECAALEEDDFVPAGGTYREEVDHTGTVKFQCCIHPWMRLEAQVSSH
jgi:plastocyanin